MEAISKLRNTAIFNTELGFTIIYYNTLILKTLCDGSTILNVGNYQTQSTVRRLNQCLSIMGIVGNVRCSKGKLYLHLITDGLCAKIPFTNGVCKFNRYTGKQLTEFKGFECV